MVLSPSLSPPSILPSLPTPFFRRNLLSFSIFPFLYFIYFFSPSRYGCPLLYLLHSSFLHLLLLSSLIIYSSPHRSFTSSPSFMVRYYHLLCFLRQPFTRTTSTITFSTHFPYLILNCIREDTCPSTGGVEAVCSWGTGKGRISRCAVQKFLTIQGAVVEMIQRRRCYVVIKVTSPASHLRLLFTSCWCVRLAGIQKDLALSHHDYFPRALIEDALFLRVFL